MRKEDASHVRPFYRIRTKFFVSMYILLILMTVTVDIAVYSVYHVDVEKKEQSSMTRILTELSRNVRSSVVSLKESMTYKMTDCGVFDYQENLSDATGYSVEKNIRSFAALMNMGNAQVRNVYIKDIFTCRFFVDTQNMYSESLDDFKQLEVYRYIEENTEELFQGRGTIRWRWFPDTPDMVYVIQSTVDSYSLDFQGVLCMGMELTYFENLFGGMSFHVALYNEVGDLLYSDLPEAAQTIETHEKLADLFDGQEYMWDETEIPREKWTLVGFSPKQEVFSALNTLMRSILLTEAVVMLAVTVFIFFLSGSITHNITALSENFRRINAGKKPKKIHYRSHDETAFLCEQFNSMENQLRETMEQMARDSTLREKAEYNALLAQMNPHFLYNALESISSMAKIEGQEEIVQAVRMLSQLLRANISGKKQEIPLAEEIDYIRQYLSLQNMVSGNRLLWDFLIEPETGQALVPKLILQPIVENAIIHGLDGVLEDPMIAVTSRRDGEDLVIEVSDNGAGLEQELADRLLQEEEPEELMRDRAHIGIKSIQKRIQILYGKHDGIRMETSPGNGMVVIIRLPYRKEVEHV